MHYFIFPHHNSMAKANRLQVMPKHQSNVTPIKLSMPNLTGPISSESICEADIWFCLWAFIYSAAIFHSQNLSKPDECQFKINWLWASKRAHKRGTYATVLSKYMSSIISLSRGSASSGIISALAKWPNCNRSTTKPIDSLRDLDAMAASSYTRKFSKSPSKTGWN